MDATPGAADAMPLAWCRSDFDPFSPDLATRLQPTLDRMRAQCPVTHSAAHDGFWVVTGYEDVLTVAQDWQTYSSAHGLNVVPAPVTIRNLPVQADPPEQRIFKRLITPFFTPSAVAAWEAPTRALVNRLIDDFAAAGECDFMAAFARPFPARAFFELAIDAPAGDLDDVVHLASRSSTPNAPDAGECWRGLAVWIRRFVASRRDQPARGDVVDAVIHADIDGRPITEDEIVGTIQLLILGGLETTAGTLGQLLARWCAEPEIPAVLRRRPQDLGRAVEEMLRMDGSFIAVARTAMRDHVLGGQPISAGDKVLVYWAGANFDGAEFADPHHFDLDRPRNRHMAFGIGPHRCAGSNLARLNLRIAVEELLRRLDDIALAPGAEVDYHSTLTRSPLTLPITFRPIVEG
jgi:cytochrome P450